MLKTTFYGAESEFRFCGIMIYRNGPKRTFLDTETDSLSTETDSLGTETDRNGLLLISKGLCGYRIVIRGVKIDRNTKIDKNFSARQCR